jgi:hypothetical protein
MEEINLTQSKVIAQPAPHLQIVQLLSGEKKVIKYPRENHNYQQRVRELIHEVAIQSLLSYADISSEPLLVFHDLKIGIVRAELEYPWGYLNDNPNAVISNSEKFAIAFAIDWITRQRDRGLGNTDNTRLQKTENGSFLFLPTDNGESLLGVNGDQKPEDDIDFNYSSSLLFSTRINSREELEIATNELKKWPVYKIIIHDIPNMLFGLGCTFSQDEQDFIIAYCDKVLHFIELRKNATDQMLACYDQAHPQTANENQIVAN